MSIKANLSAKSAVLQKKNSKKGFTLVELVIVIAVLAIIAAIAIPTVVNVINNANQSTDVTNAQSVENAIKTAQSEQAANKTTPSDRAKNLQGKSTLGDLLKIYGVDTKVLDVPKVASNTFVYDKSTGKVNCTKGYKDKDGKDATPTGDKIDSTTPIKVTDDESVEINPTKSGT